MTAGIKDKKLLIAVGNSQTYVTSDFFWSFVTLRKPLVVNVGRSKDPWDFIRNNGLINQFLNSDHDYFVRMDADQVYPENYFEVMVPLIDEYKVIGPLLFDRERHNDFIPLNFSGPGYPRPSICELTDKTGIVEIPYPHTNLFFAREVLEKIPPPWFEPRISSDALKRTSHMDVTFIEKIRDAGYKTYINLDVTVEHIAMIPIDREFYDRWNNKS